MALVHLLSSVEAQKELTAAVRETQGSKRTASWKAAARPCWWINEHDVVLRDGTHVCTGTFDAICRRKWKKGNFQAALFLYAQWRDREMGKVEPKDEAMVEEVEQPKPASRRTRRAKTEERILGQQAPVQRKRKTGKAKHRVAEETPDEGGLQPGEASEEEEGEEKQARPQTRRNLRLKDESVIPDKTSPVATPRTHSCRRSPSSSMENDDSPTPVIRRRRGRGRRKVQKTSLRVQTPLQNRPTRSVKARQRKTLVRNTVKTEPSEESIPRSTNGGDDIGSNSATPDRLRGIPSNSGDDFLPPRTRRREKELRNTTPPQNNRRISPRISDGTTRSSPSSGPQTTRKRLISDADGEDITEHPRTPLQERNDRSFLQDNRSRKKRRVTDSDKENYAPPTAAKSKSVRLRSTPVNNSKTDEPEADPAETEETVQKNDGNKEGEDFNESAEQQRKSRRIRFLRSEIELAKAERKANIQLNEENFLAFVNASNVQKSQTVNKLGEAYRTHSLKFSKQILDMPMSTFANEHGGSVDEWMIHDTEQGVNRTFEALQNGEGPREGALRPPKTPAAMSRLAALNQTARKTRRRVANETAATGLNVRRSQRTAAKVATERTRAIVSCTPRTAKREVRLQGNGNPPTSGTGMVAAIPGAFAGNGRFCSRQQMSNLAQSIRKAHNPVEALRQFTSQLQKEVFDAQRA